MNFWFIVKENLDALKLGSYSAFSLTLTILIAEIRAHVITTRPIFWQLFCMMGLDFFQNCISCHLHTFCKETPKTKTKTNKAQIKKAQIKKAEALVFVTIFLVWKAGCVKRYFPHHIVVELFSPPYCYDNWSSRCHFSDALNSNSSASSVLVE